MVWWLTRGNTISYYNDYLQQSEWPLFAATPSLIQHTGKKSMSQGAGNEAPGFVEDLEAEQ